MDSSRYSSTMPDVFLVSRMVAWTTGEMKIKIITVPSSRTKSRDQPA